MTRRDRSRRPRKLLSAYVWHRYVGLTAAVLVLVLAVSGVLLNHSTRLGLDDRFLSSEALLDWYGIHAPRDLRAFRAGGHVFTQVGEQLYMDRRLLETGVNRLVGAIELDRVLAVGFDERILLLTAEGERVETLASAEGVPSGMRRLGTGPGGRLAARGAHGDYLAGRQLLSWREGPVEGVTWAEPVTPTASLRADLRRRYRERALSLERVLLDLHSGRILGRAGPLLMDAAAVLMAFLACSGIWMWLRYRRRLRASRTGQRR